MPDAPLYSFGAFTFDSRTGLLTCGDEPVALTRRAADVLRLLVERAPRLVSKDELLEHVWRDTNVSENTLTFHIRLVRRALGDDGEAQRFIKTLPKRGYQFVSPVSVIPRDLTAPERHIRSAALPQEVTGASAEPVLPLRPSPISAPTPSRHRALRVSGVMLTLLVATLVLVAGLTESPPPHVAGITRLTSDGGHQHFLAMTLPDSRLLFHTTDGQRALRPDGHSVLEKLETVGDFQLLDVNSAGEALAIRPDDPGADLGLWIVPFNGRQPRRVGEVRATQAAWSRDGRRIAYVLDETLYVMDRSTEQVVARVECSGRPGSLGWAPDDRSIRLTRTINSDRAATSSLWDFDLGTERLTPVLDSQVQVCCGGWIPGRAEYVYLSRSSDGVSWHVMLIRDAWTVLGGHRAEIKQLTPAGRYASPVPSLDGNRIYVVKYSDPQLAIYDETSKRLRPYLGGVDGRAVDFSPDGRWLTYVDSASVLWRVDRDTGARSPLTAPPFRVSGAAWSPDSTMLALRGSTPPNQEKVYLVRVGDGEPRPIESRDIGQGVPSWSPKGLLTFGDVPEKWGQPTGRERINVYDPRTGSTVDLPATDRLLWSSRFSPDGRFIVAVTIEEPHDLYVYEVQTRQWRPLGVGHASHPTWSRDSQYVYLDPEGIVQTLRRVRVSDGQVETLLDLRQDSVDWAGLTPEGAILVTRKSADIYALELTRRSARPTVRPNPQE